MEKTKAAPQQYNQPSRKGKRAWRKNVDVSDVQTGLEDVRQELIQGSVLHLYHTQSPDHIIVDSQ